MNYDCYDDDFDDVADGYYYDDDDYDEDGYYYDDDDYYYDEDGYVRIGFWDLYEEKPPTIWQRLVARLRMWYQRIRGKAVPKGFDDIPF